MRRRISPGASVFCTRCGQEISPGEEYWYINGAVLCAECLRSYAKEDYAPFRHVLGEEWDVQCG